MNRTLEIVQGNIAHAKVDAIVNAWNRNFIPYWLLWPQAIPLLGAGTGSIAPEESADIIHAAWFEATNPLETEIWVYDADVYERLENRYDSG